MEQRDARYDLIPAMIAQGKITGFIDIFKYIPKTIVARDIGKKVDRFTDLMNHVEKFTLEDLFTIARYCEIDKSEILRLAVEEYNRSKNSILRM